MADIEVGNYGVFDDAISTGNNLNSSLTDYQSSIESNQNKLLDASVFQGPIADNCNEALTDLTTKISNIISNITTINQNLSAFKTSYLNADLDAGKIIIGEDGKITIPKIPANMKASASGFLIPFTNDVAYKVTSVFGKRRPPCEGASSDHKGIDIVAPGGTPIHAVCGGKVLSAGELGGYGNCVTVQMDDGRIVYYGHCSKVTVKKGDVIKAGDVVGKVGHTGVASGDHLHLEIRKVDSKGHKTWYNPQSSEYLGNSMPGKYKV